MYYVYRILSILLLLRRYLLLKTMEVIVASNSSGKKLQEGSEAVSRMGFPSFGVEPCAFMWSVKAMNISD